MQEIFLEIFNKADQFDAKGTGKTWILPIRLPSKLEVAGKTWR